MQRLAQQVAEELERPTRNIADGLREWFAQHGDQFAALEPAVVTVVPCSQPSKSCSTPAQSFSFR
jgi:hypothetical protein